MSSMMIGQMIAPSAPMMLPIPARSPNFYAFKCALTYDQAMRPLTTSGTSGSTVTNYVQGAGYYPHSAPQYWTYGNGLWSWETFSKLLQPYQGWASQGNNGNNWMFYAGNAFNANGTVSGQQEGFSPSGTPGVPWNSMTFLNGQFGYDSLNRLNSVVDTNYTRTYSYDAFGNLSVLTNTEVPLSGLTPVNNGTSPYTTTTNHLVAVDVAGGYEPRGNMTKLGAVTMAYDGESNMPAASRSARRHADRKHKPVGASGIGRRPQAPRPELLSLDPGPPRTL